MFDTLENLLQNDCFQRTKRVTHLAIGNVLLRLFVISVLAATATELTKLQPVGRSFLILSRNVVAALTLEKAVATAPGSVIRTFACRVSGSLISN